ncbi:fokIR protein [Pediococcus claussenii]|nr:fokIR protein [Pediococcus claussenii]
MNSKIQTEIKESFEWRFIDDDVLKEKLFNKLTTNPVTLTVDDLSAEQKKEPGKPASWRIKSILPAILKGQKPARNQDNTLATDNKGESFKSSMRQWPIRNFIGEAVGLGLLDWDRKTGNVTITTIGKKLANAPHNDDEELTLKETEIFQQTFISYPYAVGFLKALQGTKGLNKFQLGERFGFAGEAGFTSFGEELYINGMIEAYENNDQKLISQIRSNWESTSDKYIRGLANVLKKLNLVNIDAQVIPYTNKQTNEKEEFAIPIYKITGIGRQQLGIALGKSSHSRSTKNVTWDMLATKGNITYIRTVRALILKALSESNKLTSIELADKVNNNRVNKNQVLDGITVSPEEIEDHIAGLNGIGLQIDSDSSKVKKYTLVDRLADFEIPINAKDLPQKDQVQQQQDELRPMLKNVDHRYLQLVELALDSDQNSEYSQFEQLTMELVLKHLDFDGKPLGGSNKPDGIAWDNDGNFIIFDTKAYNKGYSLAGNTDKVKRYIDDVRDRDTSRTSTWWQLVPKSIDVHNLLRFVYVSGNFTGNYMKLLDSLRSWSNAQGGLASVEKLLLTSELYLRNMYSHQELIDSWTDNNVKHDEYFLKIEKQLTIK